jgi:hypothetical protein
VAWMRYRHVTYLTVRASRQAVERAGRPVAQYSPRIDPPDLIAGGATAREEIQ